ncbi:hypothetical protein [Mucilaginibacter glaciei]|uniref:Uncharacterized protein n=1 Tax=Mucilaginibacter glaciei TaxID=2772109 RepID=A0A926S0D8_9SPHI|nr:hypothetical protein [Mucilaginibacter glaciei]MBD1391913.1 hypothetical protein [Mucilaginibacter glaciei]
MNEKTIEDQTRLYLFDLTNTAKEFGFKTDDVWEFSVATDAERIKIQKDFYPTISAKVFPEIMLQVYHGIRERLNQSFNKEEQQLDNRAILNGQLNYLVAYNLKRPRT